MAWPNADERLRWFKHAELEIPAPMSRLPESWHEYRKRMLRETSRFIEWGLKHPELTIQIPSKPVGDGGFPKGVGDWFWGVVLTTRNDPRVLFWRNFLINKPLELIGRAVRKR